MIGRKMTNERFVPELWQIDPWKSTAPTLLLTGSAGGGKSYLAANKIHGFCLKYKGATAVAMRKAYEYTTRSIVPFLQETVICENQVHYNKSERTFYYPNGSVIYVAGMLDDGQREAFRSIGGTGGLDIVWMEEANAFTETDYNEILARMRGRAAPWTQVILTTNPDSGSHWIKTRLIDGGEAEVHYSKAADNPYNPPAYHERLLKLTGLLRDRLVLGLWKQAEGAVFDGFDRQVHVRERGRNRYQAFALALDEGYTNPAVVLVVGIDADLRIHVFEEFYETGKLQSEVVAQASKFALDYGARVAVVDNAAAGLIADLRNYGIDAQGGKGRVNDGINWLQDALKVQGDGMPRLTIDPSCVNTINDFESYVWKPGKDEPVKANDHSIDALRYLVNFMFGSEITQVQYRYDPVRIE